MDRRLFLHTAGTLGLALGFLQASKPFRDIYGLLQNSNNDNIPFFSLSLAQWSLNRSILETKTLKPLDFPRKAKELGFDAVEYVSHFYKAENFPGYTLETLIKELKKRSQDNGLENVILMVDNEGELATGKKSDRTLAIENHYKWIDAAKELGCHSVRVNLFGEGTEHDFSLWKDAASDGLGRLSEYAAKSNMNVIVENHGGMTSDASKLIEVIKLINLRNCGTLPDFGNFCLKREGGDRWITPCIEEYDRYLGVKEMMPFAKGVSAKSYDFDTNGKETLIDYKKMLKIVKDAGYTGRIGVEYEGKRLNEEEGIRLTKALLLTAASEL